jgi:hypothetical protein
MERTTNNVMAIAIAKPIPPMTKSIFVTASPL